MNGPLGGRRILGGGLGRGQRRADVSWWLAGGVIDPANCIAAYQPKGAASYAASKVNLANPGTYDAVDGAAYPTWSADTGWTFNKLLSQYLKSCPRTAYTTTGIIRYTNNPASVMSAQAVMFGLEDRWEADPYTTVTYNPGFAYRHANWIYLPGDKRNGGVYALGRYKGWFDGELMTNALDGNRSETWYIAIGGRSKNADCTVVNFHQSFIAQAVAFYNIELTTAQVAAVTIAMNAL